MILIYIVKYQDQIMIKVNNQVQVRVCVANYSIYYIFLKIYHKYIPSHNKLVWECNQNVCDFYFPFPKYIELARDQDTARSHTNLFYCHYPAQTNRSIRDVGWLRRIIFNNVEIIALLLNYLIEIFIQKSIISRFYT